MKAIDLYSGIGGWHLGFELAGVEIISSYEWWNIANETHIKNFSSKVVSTDIRKMDFNELPKKVDIIVGSPPCTQFSFANRGGNGNISDGLVDICKFLEIVEYLQPKYWVMENVPRVAGILERELSSGGSLAQFKDLFSAILVVNMTDYGLPQNRKRMLAGHFPSELLESYRGLFEPPSLGEVISSLAQTRVKDVLYGMSMGRKALTENEDKSFLDREETRMNREAKSFHPVYNRMSFPDCIEKPARTITATCTKVSRESIVVDDNGRPRLLTLRESSSLQGFPMTFQFFGRSYSDKLKMIGNAFPPIMSYYVAHSILGTKPDKIEPPSKSSYKHPLPNELPRTTPCSSTKSFPATRKFRFAVPNLRFGSGVRFELSNCYTGNSIEWKVRFFYGTSKNILVIEPVEEMVSEAKELCASERLNKILDKLNDYLQNLTADVSSQSLQAVWSHREQGTHPFSVIDKLGEYARKIHESLPKNNQRRLTILVAELLAKETQSSAIIINRKVLENSDWIISGMLVGAMFNSKFGTKKSPGTKEMELSLA